MVTNSCNLYGVFEAVHLTLLSFLHIYQNLPPIKQFSPSNPGVQKHFFFPVTQSSMQDPPFPQTGHIATRIFKNKINQPGTDAIFVSEAK